MKFLNQIKKLSIATIIVGFIAGILFILYPAKCIDYVSYAVGAAFIACALVGVIVYLIDKSSAFSLGMGIVLGIIGIIICIMHNQIISFIVIMIGVFVLLSGVVNLFTAFRMFVKSKAFGWFTFIIAVISIVLGAIAITRSRELTEAIVRFIGISLIVYAVFDLIAFIEVKILYRDVKKQQAVTEEAASAPEGDIEVNASEVN